MKKILSLLMILALMIGALVGCGEKTGIEAVQALTPQEIYTKVQEKGQEATNASFLADFDLEMSGLESMGFAGPMGLTIAGDVKDAENMKMTIEADTGQGMTINAEMYLTGDKMLIHAPILESFMGYAYMTADVNTIAEQAGAQVTQPDPAKIQGIMKRFEETTDYSMYDIIKLADTKEAVDVTVNEATVKAVKLTADVQLEGAEETILGFVEFMLTDEEAKEVFFANMSDEDIASTLAEIQDENAVSEFKKGIQAIQLNQFSIVTYVNENYEAVKVEMVMDASFTDPSTEETMNIKFNGYVDSFNIGGVKDIVLPEVEEDQILNLNDML